jgi:predicted transcriptional regulator
MSTTSLKIHDALKQRAVAVAQLHGLTPHAFMVQAIELATQASEHRAGFISEAKTARENMRSTGKGYDADEVHTYLKARAAGQDAAKPRPKSWRK